jgi:hypothetical protein
MRRLAAVCLTCFEAFLLVALAYGITFRGDSSEPKRRHRSAAPDHAIAVACNAAELAAPFACGSSIDRSLLAKSKIVRFLPGTRAGEAASDQWKIVRVPPVSRLGESALDQEKQSNQETQNKGRFHEIKLKPQAKQPTSTLFDAAGLRNKLLASLGALAPAVLAIAVLAFGKSLNFIEAKVETALDQLIFRRRLRIGRNLKSLLADCKRIGNADDLLRVCADQLRPLTGARRLAFYELRDGRYVPTCADSACDEAPDQHVFVPLHRDDQAMLRVTGQHGPVETVGLATALPPKSVAFPMLSAGRLIGAVVCEGRAERFDSEELQLIADFAHDVGATLVFLRSAYHSPAALTEHAVYDITHIWSRSKSRAPSEARQPA